MPLLCYVIATLLQYYTAFKKSESELWIVLCTVGEDIMYDLMRLCVDQYDDEEQLGDVIRQ